MSDEKLRGLEDEIAAQTRITPKEQAEAAGAQAAAEHTMASAAGFAADQMTAFIPAIRIEQKPNGVTIVPPYNEEELFKKEELLKKSGIEFQQDIYKEYKSHLLSALAFASNVGINIKELLNALSDYVKQNKTPYLVHYKLGSYFVEEYIVRKIAQRKDLKIPESLEPTDERKSFMADLASSLTNEERQNLARYVASTQEGYSISPFYSQFSIDVTTREGLRRQNIALAIAPQSFEKDLIQNFLSQEGIRKENALLSLANPYLRDSMPLGALMAGEYRVALQDSPFKEVSMREALEEQIERSYTKRPIGIEPKGLLPLEELAGLVVVNGLKQLPQEGLQSRFNKIIPRVLQAENPLAALEQAFPDIRLWFDKREMDRLNTDIDALKKAVAEPDKVPTIYFWLRALMNDPYKISYFQQVINTLISQIYETGGKNT